MPIPRPRIRAALLSILMITASLPLAAQLLTTSEWKLKVTVDAAAVRLKPELEGPIAAIVPKGTILQSYEATGAWYRVLTTSAKDGTSVIGYIATSDVEVVEEKTAPPADFWPVQAQPYRGIGLAVRLYGGLGVISSPDVDASLDGMAALAAEAILAKGYSPVTQDVSPLHSGPIMGGDLVFAISPRLSVGAGFSYTRANRSNVYSYSQVLNFEYSLDSTALLQVYAYRLEAAYTIPLNQTAGLVLSAGPALYHAQYIHMLAWADADSVWTLHQDTRQSVLGGHAGLALEINLNNRVSLFVQALGRLARFAALSGTETLTQESGSYALPTQNYQGDLYFIDDGGFSRTAVRDAPPPGPGPVRKMVVDYSGITFLFGFRMKF